MELKNEVTKVTKIVNSHGEEIKAKLKDRTELNLWKFGRHDSEIALLTEEGNHVDFPDYTKYSRSSFGFGINTGILAKQCCKCKDWFVIATLSSEGEWDKIANKEVHFDNTRFRSYCNSCYKGVKSEKEASGATRDPSSKSDSQVKRKKTPRPGAFKTSVNLTENERYFLKLVAAIDRVRVEDVLARMIERERKERDLKL